MSVKHQDGDLYLSVPDNDLIADDLKGVIYEWNKAVLKVEEARNSNVGYIWGYQDAVEHVAPCIHALFEASVHALQLVDALFDEVKEIRDLSNDLSLRMTEKMTANLAIGGRLAFDIGLEMFGQISSILTEIGRKDGGILNDSGNNARLRAFVTCFDNYGKLKPSTFLLHLASLLIELGDLTVKERKEPEAIPIVMALLNAISMQTSPLKGSLETVAMSLQSQHKDQVWALECFLQAFLPVEGSAQIAVLYFFIKKNPVRQFGNDAAHPLEIGMSYSSMEFLVEQVDINMEDKEVLRQISHNMEKIQDEFKGLKFGYGLKELKKEKGKGKGKGNKKNIFAILGETEHKVVVMKDLHDSHRYRGDAHDFKARCNHEYGNELIKVKMRFQSFGQSSAFAILQDWVRRAESDDQILDNRNCSSLILTQANTDGDSDDGSDAETSDMYMSNESESSTSHGSSPEVRSLRLGLDSFDMHTSFSIGISGNIIDFGSSSARSLFPLPFCTLIYCAHDSNVLPGIEKHGGCKPARDVNTRL
ncbi:hypothetical protein A7U60_g4328 [Sanghuangporus baumii]|uniref:Uncharacterized protein n=1 Tax=Sanghuangporus baumii TaxID=108892 RepID=A0A9Q5HYT1_SANBA|nr:hypothetical protein A7U60_g4328 [Sanghuangporus baumii]